MPEHKEPLINEAVPGMKPPQESKGAFVSRGDYFGAGSSAPLLIVATDGKYFPVDTRLPH